ncbi:MAG: GIY-YIG nuclease family protein, partial [Lachnospiraceae bacterium]|nr:GIY-YIG nuclease family protein [Lachnospiraceae bacterium]
CEDGSLYTGSTNDIEKRYEKHLNGTGAKYTRAHKPVRIAYSECFKTKSEALRREIQIKKLKRSEKLELIR